MLYSKQVLLADLQALLWLLLQRLLVAPCERQGACCCWVCLAVSAVCLF